MNGKVLKYESVTWMQIVKDKSGKEFYIMGPMEGMPDTLAVTPKGGNGGTMFFCKKHDFAYGIHEACLDCRIEPRPVPTE